MNALSLLVYTDLDGTLLNHHDYNYRAALPVIDKLHQQDIPIIPTTSKTVDELLALRKELNLQSPFIAENGAAILIPEKYFSKQPVDTICKDGFWIKENVKRREHWQKLLSELPLYLQNCFISFKNAGLDGIVKMTGLSEAQALLASKRQYGEPLKWHGDEKDLEIFTQSLKKEGANILIGGRFIHVSGHCDKGQALEWLTNIYKEEYSQEFTSLALGDSGNDIAMLNAADLAIVIKAEKALSLERQEQIYYTQASAPEGWAEGIEYFLTLLHKKA